MQGPSDSFNAGERAVLESVATGAALPQLLEDIVRFIEAQADGMLCSILLLDADDRLRHGAAPSLPPEYVQAMDDRAISPAAGPCGVAAIPGERVIARDIATHPGWAACRHLALPHGLRACWSSPIVATQGSMLGMLVMYYRENRSPTEQEIQWVNVAAQLASLAILRDRSEQSLRRSEARAKQLARLYAVSSGVNEAIVRVRDAQRLYDFACRIAVEQGLARLAWVGLCDAAELTIHPVARHGADASYVDSLELNLADERMNQGTAGRAVATGEPVSSNDIARDPHFYRKEAALARGLQSCAVFPLKIAERTIGIMALYAEGPYYFLAEEMQVLTALAADISFAVELSQKEQEQRRMEEAVRSGEALRAMIYSSVEDIIFYLAVEAPDRYRFLSVNPAFLNATGLSEAQVVGRSVDEVIPEPSLTLVRSRYRQAIAQREKVSWEESTRYPAGEKQGEVTISPIFDANGHCTNLVGTVHDITLRKQAETQRAELEAQLHQAQRMQSLGTLAGGIAHDFNNILAAISVNTDIALAESPPSAVLVEHLLEVQKASRRAIELVRQILTFSRHEPPQRTILDLRPITREALNLLRAAFPQSVEIITRFAEDTPIVAADPTQIHQIVMNLGTNAALAVGARGGVIEISLDGMEIGTGSLLRIADLAAGRYARLRVTDNGVGMDEATLKRVFDPFFTTRAPGEGTGLGLSVVHGIVQSHNGAVDVRSEPGRGTTFTVYLPASDAQVKTSTATDLVSGHGERILYVDDEEPMVFLATRALARLGYQVTGHSDSRAALEEFRARPDEFDVVVTDLSMPGLSGGELAAELRQIRPDVPIIMASGYIRSEDRQAAQRLHINQLVYKPNTIEELGQLLSREITALRTRRSMPAESQPAI